MVKEWQLWYKFKEWVFALKSLLVWLNWRLQMLTLQNLEVEVNLFCQLLLAVKAISYYTLLITHILPSYLLVIVSHEMVWFIYFLFNLFAQQKAWKNNGEKKVWEHIWESGREGWDLLCDLIFISDTQKCHNTPLMKYIKINKFFNTTVLLSFKKFH